MRRHVGNFNRHDHTHFGQAISNEAAADWMAANVPLFDCPDKEIEEIYHFRWWTFRKHTPWYWASRRLKNLFTPSQ